MTHTLASYLCNVYLNYTMTPQNVVCWLSRVQISAQRSAYLTVEVLSADPTFLLTNAEKYLKLDSDRLLPHSFQFTVH